MGLRSRSVSSVAGMGMDPSTAGGVPFGLYTPASRGTGNSERAPSGGGSASDSTYAHGNGYQETGGGHHRDGMLYLGSRASLADALPLHIAPRWFSSHSGFKCPICSKSVASDEMEMHFIMCLSKPRLSYNEPPDSGLSIRDESQPCAVVPTVLRRLVISLLYNSAEHLTEPSTHGLIAPLGLPWRSLRTEQLEDLHKADDVLTKDAGECVICLEELLQGDTIARLPCLCIYHKSCIDSWFEVNRSCPEHPAD
ncbi:E3 ubiquitin-protein ligase ZNRF1 [Fukomys damarensis]|uniref:E3 ubiquitin-protein ligase ZNRF1 n=1 Tax=Fukomys damarensis TaxID=885580 RepID=A0A091D293_FUKDA|nr:E3 ubiquitin-protein ligase ZNRF1 [Fukomys damarensis]